MSRLRRPSWFDERAPSWGRRAQLAPLVPLSWLYRLGAFAARRSRSSGLRPPARLACRVVSIGNLAVGGSGKTPAAAWVAARLRERGHKVALASRGYGRTERDPVRVVSDGRFVHAGLEQAGDEPLLLAAHAPGVPVLVGPDRSVVGLRALSAFGVDVLVLDDGFQHHRLARDVDLVCFDGGTGLGNARLLPRGPLREGLGALRFADALLVVDGPLPERDEQRIAARAPLARWFRAWRRPAALRPLAGGAGEPPAWLAGREVGLLAGLAHPGSLRATLARLGARVVAERLLPDHHRYRERDLAGLAEQAPLWVTTEKDGVKILPRWARGLDLRVLAVRLEVDEAEELVDWLDRSLRH
ncbi:MAG: tetraacyldisaccharide 4'-kinase [Myxococcota bacterium]|nr:tetraacyldisaccharide 4'-kinase [Myxococcota bacterium]